MTLKHILKIGILVSGELVVTTFSLVRTSDIVHGISQCTPGLQKFIV